MTAQESRKGKTAVLIIHGVGEQRPLATARGFVRFFAGKHFRSKPDKEAELFELRRLSTYAGDDDPTALADARKEVGQYPTDTVFYEYYWAFHYRDTQVALVVRWACATLIGFFRVKQWQAVRPGVWLVVGVWLALLVGALAALVWGIADLASRDAHWWTTAKLIGGPALTALVWLTRPVFLGWVGDAARYFGHSPSNPVERQEIRARGIQILKRLHDRKVTNLANPEDPPCNEYDRIVVVGHSLGSVVAYDILTHYWAEVSPRLQIPKGNVELEDARDVGEAGEPTASPDSWMASCKDPDEWRMKQTLLARSARADAQTAADGKRQQAGEKTSQASEKRAEAAALQARLTKVSQSAESSEDDIQSLAVELAKAQEEAVAMEAKAGKLMASATNRFDAWRVSDLVTLGCPLTYARFLIAKDGADLAEKQGQRELPTCPPTKDRYADEDGLKSFVFYYKMVTDKDHLVPNTSAPFLLTRWTNIYLSQDPIGGPLRAVFGWGVRDLEVSFTTRRDRTTPAADGSSRKPAPETSNGAQDLRTPTQRLQDLLGAAHNRYWDLRGDNANAPMVPDCARELRAIVRGSDVHEGGGSARQPDKAQNPDAADA